MAMCHLYRIDHDITTDLVHMADASNDRNYTEDHHDTGIEDRHRMHADLEAIATVQVHYSAGLVPDLLQTPAYAHAVITADTTVDKKIAQRRVDHRILRRQTFFNRDEPGRLEIVLPASALDLPVGSAETMAEQIAHLIAADDRDEVSIQILPGLHGYTDGSFTIMDFDDPDDPSVVCMHSLVDTRYIERPQQVHRYRQAAELLGKQAVPLTEYLRDRPHPWARARTGAGADTVLTSLTR